MITQTQLQKFREAAKADQRLQATAAAVGSAGLEQASLVPQVTRNHPFAFSVTTEMGEITNQKSSGRCWMFASLNAARVAAMKKYNLKTFEFSQTYTFFWDKLEKSNAFLEAILETADEDLHGRLVSFLLMAPIQDGGQWDMFSGLLAKYGVVPKSVMPETYHSSNSRVLVGFLTSKLREYAHELRQRKQACEPAEALEARKTEMLEFVYKVLVRALGEPPTDFVFEYTDKDDVFHRTKRMTPKEFYEEFIGWKLEDKVSLIHAPTEDKPYYRCYTVKYLNSVVEGRPIRYLNLPMDELKRFTIAALKNGDPVWFGCDVGKYLNREKGIMDLHQFRYEDVLGEGLKLTKAERLDYGDSVLTHAMVLTGVNLDDEGKPLTWKVENSWGDKSGNKGVFSMADDWFDEFTYEVMVDRSLLDDKALKALDGELTALEPWDPFGALAKMED